MKKRRVAITAEARADLLQIFDFTAHDSSATALRLVDRLEAAAFELAETALHYQVISERNDVAIRRRVVGSYNIIFGLIGDRVEVFHVLYGKRDIGAALDEDTDQPRRRISIAPASIATIASEISAL